MSVPTNLIPTKITGLPEYQGTSVDGYLPYVIDGRTYKVRFGNIAAVGAVPSTRRVATGTGLAGGGDLSEDRTIYIPNGGVGDDQLSATGVTGGTYGSSTQIPIITVDFKGRLTSASSVALEVPVLDLSDPSKTQGALPLGRGGTGSVISPAPGAIPYSTASSLALTSVGLAGQVLMSGGTGAPYWSTVTGTGTVTSVDASGGTTGLTFTGGPVTTVGTLTLGGTLAIAHGGTGATDAATARVNIGAAASGANSDITSMSGITGAIGTPDHIDFDTAATVTRATGRLWWDNADGNQTLSLGMAGSNATLQVGQEMYFRIKATAPITEGQGVMFTGTVGASGALTGAPASGLTKDTASYFMGVATEDIPLNSWGYVTQFGLVRGINTTGGAEAWVDGQILYYNPAVPGGLTKTVPAAPAAKIEVAAVVHAASNGSIFVRPVSRFSLGQLNDLETSAAADLDLLQYNGPAGYWQHKSPSLISVGSATNLAGGAANRIAYQTGAGATGFIVAPTVANTYLEWSGSAFQWSSNPLGTVTSVNASGGTTGLTFSGGPVTTAGTLTLGGTLAVASGGTGATSLTSGYLLKGNGTSAVSASVVYDNGTNVGIGTTSPNAKLTVAGAITSYQAGVTDQIIFTPQTAGSGALLLAVNEANNAYRQMTIDGSPVVINTAGTEKVRVLSNGNVGIGTSSPASPLEVYNASGGWIRFGNASGTGEVFADGSATLIGSVSNHPLLFRIGSAEKMRIDTSGNVGIGTTPACALDVYSAASGVIQVKGGSGTNQGAAYYVKYAGSSSTLAAFGDRARIFGGTPDQLVSIFTGALPLTFDVNGGEKVRIDTSGNFLVGTSSAYAKLTVAGSDIATNALVSGATRGVRIGANSTYGYIEGVDNTGSASYQPLMLGGSDVRFSTSGVGTERMRIDSSGNVGIGTSSSLSSGLTVARGAGVDAIISLRGNGNGSAAEFSFTQASDGTSTYIQNRANGFMAFNTNNTERLRITAAGLVGVGTNSPTYRLHVSTSGVNALGVYRDLDVTSVGAAGQLIEIGARDGTTFTPGASITGVLNNPATTGYLSFETRAAGVMGERMRITSAGDVGIGNSAPGCKLDVTGAISSNGTSGIGTNLLLVSSGASPNIQFNRAGYQNWYIGSPNTSADFYISEGSSSTYRMYFKSAGDVGIGTSSPEARLHVFLSSGVVARFGEASTGAVTNIHNRLAALPTTGTGTNIGWLDSGSGFAAGSLLLGARPAVGLVVLSSSGAADMVVNTSGNVGIGTSSPGVKLHIEGTSDSSLNLVRIRNTSNGTSAATAMHLGNDVSDIAARISMGANTNTTAQNTLSINNRVISTSSKITFATQDTERMRIDASGNLNLGQAASALQSGGTGITVYGATASEIKFLNSTTGAVSTDGTALVASGSDFVINNREAGVITFGTSNTERMRVFSGGDVGIGTSSSYAVLSDRTLFVAGSSYASLNLVCGGAYGGAGMTVDSSTNLQIRNAGAERMRIDSSGNVGIGLTSYSSKLTVAGTIESTTGGVKFPDATTQTTKGIAAAWAQITSITTTSGTTAIFSNIPQTYTALRFAIVGVSHNGGTNGSIRMSVSSDGVTYSAAWNLGASIAAAATIDGALQGDSYTQDTCFFIGDAISSANASPYVSVNGTYFMFKVTGGVKYVKFEWSQGASFDAGSITLYGR